MMCSVVRALVLAAGASSRMGRPKAALPISDPGDTFTLRVIRTLSAAGLPDILVVTGCMADAVQAAAGRTDRRVRFVHNPNWAEGQLSSLVAGLQSAAREHHTLEALLVTLVDVPLVSADTVRRVLQAWRSTRAPIVRPARGETHGHPVIFDRAVFEELRAADPQLGAKAVVRAHEKRILDVPTVDEGAFLAVDTEDQYRRAIGARSLAVSKAESRPR